jgi:hypothetical protein
VFFIGIFYEILIEKHNLNINDVELSILASISKGYTAGQILETIEKVIRTKQETKYSNNLYTANDFIPTLGLKSPVFVDEENKIKVRNQHFLFLPFTYIKSIELV